MTGEQNLWGFAKTPRFDGDRKPDVGKRRRWKKEKKKTSQEKSKLFLLLVSRKEAKLVEIGESKVGFKYCRIETRAGNVAVWKRVADHEATGRFFVRKRPIIKNTKCS